MDLIHRGKRHCGPPLQSLARKGPLNPPFIVALQRNQSNGTQSTDSESRVDVVTHLRRIQGGWVVEIGVVVGPGERVDGAIIVG